MPHHVLIDDAGAVGPGSSKAYTVEDRELAVFNLDGTLYAIENLCPHAGAALSDGDFDGATVTCPRHEWNFDLKSGHRLDGPAPSLRRFEIEVRDGSLFVDLDSAGESGGNNGQDIDRYIVRYGALGWVECFGTVHALECCRGDRVVLSTRRGTEIGEILAAPGDPGIADAGQPTGEIDRRATDEDNLRFDELGPVPDVLFAAARRMVDQRGLPAEVIDGERLFDRETLVLYYLGEDVPELGNVGRDLGRMHGVRVLMQPVIERPAPAGGCGSGCGSGGCGSGSGGCG